MVTIWQNIKHKFSASEHKIIKREASAELSRMGRIDESEVPAETSGPQEIQ